MDPLKTALGSDIPVEARGILYLCTFTGKELIIERELMFGNALNALNAYANIPNPESQLITGKTYDELIKKHTKFMERKDTPEFINYLKDVI